MRHIVFDFSLFTISFYFALRLLATAQWCPIVTENASNTTYSTAPIFWSPNMYANYCIIAAVQKSLLLKRNLAHRFVTVRQRSDEGNIISHICLSVCLFMGTGDPCTGPRPRPPSVQTHASPRHDRTCSTWTFTYSNLPFQGHAPIYSLCSPYFRKAGGWYSIEVPSC